MVEHVPRMWETLGSIPSLWGGDGPNKVTRKRRAKHRWVCSNPPWSGTGAAHSRTPLSFRLISGSENAAWMREAFLERTTGEGKGLAVVPCLSSS